MRKHIHLSNYKIGWWKWIWGLGFYVSNAPLEQINEGLEGRIGFYWGCQWTASTIRRGQCLLVEAGGSTYRWQGQRNAQRNSGRTAVHSREERRVGGDGGAGGASPRYDGKSQREPPSGLLLLATQRIGERTWKSVGVFMVWVSKSKEVSVRVPKFFGR